jgi:hypothetical protein
VRRSPTRPPSERDLPADNLPANDTSFPSFPAAASAAVLDLDANEDIVAQTKVLTAFILKKWREAGAAMPSSANAAAFVSVPGATKERFGMIQCSVNCPPGGVLTPRFHSLHGSIYPQMNEEGSK